MKIQIPFFILVFFGYAGYTQEKLPLYRIIEEDKFGFINKEGKMVIPPAFSYAYDFSEGLSVARKEGKYGYLDKSGRWAIPPQFDFAQAFQGGLAVVSEKGYDYLINASGKKITSIAYDQIEETELSGYFRVMIDKKLGLIDKNGHVLLQPLYTKIEYSAPSYFLVYKEIENRKLVKGLLDKTGSFIWPFGRYANIQFIGNGTFWIQENRYDSSLRYMKSHYALLKPNGNKIQLPFDQLNAPGPYNEFVDDILLVFHHKKSCVKAGNCSKYYPVYLDTTGKVVLNDSTLECDYTTISNGRIEVHQDTKVKYFDKSGKSIGEEKYIQKYRADTIKVFEFPSGICVENIDLHYVPHQEVYRVTHTKNKQFKPFELEEIDNKGVVNGLLAARQGEKLVYLNENGKIVWRQHHPKLSNSVAHPRFIGQNPKLVFHKDSKCGLRGDTSYLRGKMDIDSTTKAPIYTFEWINTTCDTLSFFGIGTELGRKVGSYDDFYFADRPQFQYYGDCELITPRESILFLDDIPPNYSAVFTVPRLTGCCEARFILKVNFNATLKRSSNCNFSTEMTTEVKGMYDPELYRGEPYYFIDNFYYKMKHSQP